MSRSPLSSETGTVRKKWKGLLPVALLYPNSYPLAVSNLGFQLVYSLLNELDFIVCERFVYPVAAAPLRSLESNRLLTDFPLVLGSISFEHDFPRFAGMLAAGGIEPFTENRTDAVGSGSPLVVLGGVGVFMNPEPLAPFADLMVIGEAEPVLSVLVQEIAGLIDRQRQRPDILRHLGRMTGCYAPSLYSFSYDEEGRVRKITPQPGMPGRISKVVQNDTNIAAHSMQMSPEAELGMYMTELGRGCSRGCRFCAAGFIYRPPRLWSSDAILRALEERPAGVDRVGLLGMEMAEPDVLDRIAGHLQEHGCSLSFSSLRADRISDQLLSLLAGSGLKSVAIAPDGCSERLRRVINKGLCEQDLLDAAVALVGAGIVHLKLYVMIGLPTETEQDLDELIALIQRLGTLILPIGRKRGRVSEITLSVNSFVPKPWTPFQYLSFGGLDYEQALADRDCSQAVMALKRKIKYLRKAFTGAGNLRLKVDRPDRVLQQAVFSRGDRRLASVLFDIGTGRSSFKQAMKKYGLTPWEYALRPRDENERMCWEIVDHGIDPGYLYQEYCKAMNEKLTVPCDPGKCRRCGVCNEPSAV
ncbi:MAG: radical SAM protein [Desulfobulbaceae bacterium]|nr:radical SAM protein [Desulfobulbaceae bacterium]